jgi:hypothetical protein
MQMSAHDSAHRRDGMYPRRQPISSGFDRKQVTLAYATPIRNTLYHQRERSRDILVYDT